MLQEIRKGIWSFNKNGEDRTDNVIIAVHPYFGRYFPRASYFPDYERKLDKLVAMHRGALIVMESHTQVERIADQIQRENNTYFIKTEPQSPKPTEITWEELLDFFDELKPPFKMIGGQLGYWKDRDGCLGSMMNLLEGRGGIYDFKDPKGRCYEIKTINGLTYESPTPGHWM